MAYILLNTLIYGSVGMCFIYFLAYYKILNLSLGGFLIVLMYLIYLVSSNHSLIVGFLPGMHFELSMTSSLWGVVVFFCSTLLLYLGVGYVCYRFFPNPVQRDLFAIIFTIALALFLENMVGFLFGGGAVSIVGFRPSTPFLLLAFGGLNIVLIYLFSQSFVGTFFAGIAQNAGVVKSLGFHVHRTLCIGSLGCLLILAFAGFLILTREGVRPTDGLFYLLVGVAMLVLTGVEKIQFVFLAALVYVALEYVLFVSIGVPIAYKSPTILVIILFILLFRPEGIFSFSTHRRI